MAKPDLTTREALANAYTKLGVRHRRAVLRIARLRSQIRGLLKANALYKKVSELNAELLVNKVNRFDEERRRLESDAKVRIQSAKIGVAQSLHPWLKHDPDCSTQHFPKAGTCTCGLDSERNAILYMNPNLYKANKP